MRKEINLTAAIFFSVFALSISSASFVRAEDVSNPQSGGDGSSAAPSLAISVADPSPQISPNTPYPVMWQTKGIDPNTPIAFAFYAGDYCAINDQHSFGVYPVRKVAPGTVSSVAGFSNYPDFPIAVGLAGDGQGIISLPVISYYGCYPIFGRDYTLYAEATIGKGKNLQKIRSNEIQFTLYDSRVSQEPLRGNPGNGPLSLLAITEPREGSYFPPGRKRQIIWNTSPANSTDPVDVSLFQWDGNPKWDGNLVSRITVDGKSRVASITIPPDVKNGTAMIITVSSHNNPKIGTLIHIGVAGPVVGSGGSKPYSSGSGGGNGTSTPSVVPTISLAPIQDGTVQAGKKTSIGWTSTGLKKTSKVSIFLVGAGSTTLLKTTSNSGSASILIPKNTPAGNYQVSLSSGDASSTSPLFVVTASSGAAASGSASSSAAVSCSGSQTSNKEITWQVSVAGANATHVSWRGTGSNLDGQVGWQVTARYLEYGQKYARATVSLDDGTTKIAVCSASVSKGFGSTGSVFDGVHSFWDSLWN